MLPHVSKVNPRCLRRAYIVVSFPIELSVALGRAAWDTTALMWRAAAHWWAQP